MAAWLLVLSLLVPQSAAVRKLAREVVEGFGREALERAEPRVIRLLETLGDDAAKVLRRTGPAGVGLLERHGAPALGLLVRYGDDAFRILTHEGEAALAAVARHGDAAMRLMIRHPGVGRTLLEEFGEGAGRLALGDEGAVALARLAAPIRSSGRGAEILGVVERFGDRACAFLWRNKGAVFGAAALAAFLADPKPYLDGVKTLVTEPLAAGAREAAARADWTSILAVGLVGASLLLGWRWSRARPRA
jgi:hypothetical protein